MIRLTKFIIIFSLIALISSCGYTPIYSKKDSGFSIENIEFYGDRDVKKNINSSIDSYKNIEDKEKKVSLILVSSKSRTVSSKNSKGEAQIYRLNVEVKMKLILSENDFFEKTIMESGTYSAVKRKSVQKTIENKLIEDLSKQISRKIISEIIDKTK